MCWPAPGKVVVGGGVGSLSGVKSSRVAFALLALTVAPWLHAQAVIPAEEAALPPTGARLATIAAAAQRDGWAPQVAMVRATAIKAYQLDRLPAAEAWFNVYRWAALFGETEARFIPRWIRAIEEARVAHPNMPVRYEMRDRPIGLALSPTVQAWLIGHPAFSAEFFALLSPVDFLPNVFRILDELCGRDPARAGSYGSLVVAIALVYDVPPPPDWPHGQVSPAALSRKLPAAADAFAWWVRQDQLGRLNHKLARLGADELKFVVDAAAPSAELEWSQQVVDLPLTALARAYTMVRYRTDRISSERPIWPGRTYRLADVLRDGGICVDQAYFATQVGKARGVPTLLFHGAGNDARHAWFGYLDGNQKWQLDAGRYAEQKFITGFARDPQTWRELTDHELQFMAERFHELPSFGSSRVHAEFAADFLAAGEGAAASAAARKAVNFERRNQAGWEILVAADRQSSRDALAAEKDLREAALAFQRYPDLEANYVNRLTASLRARGQTSEADAEERRIARKNQGDRKDLSIAQARETLQRAIATQPLPEQLKVYRTVVDSYGRGAGIGFLDAIVRPFVEHLLQLGQAPEARQAVDRARQALKVEPNSQLEQEFAALNKALKRPN